MAKKKYYAVKEGRNKGIFETWEECEKQIKGFSGAIYKSFNSIKEAEDYLNPEKAIIKTETPNNEKKSNVNIYKNAAVAYVDGSYNDSKKMYGSGAIILFEGKEIPLMSFGNDEDYLSMRNVAGEIKAVELALNWCIQNNIEEIAIYHDYQGISDWCNGNWKANKKGTKEYKDFYEEVSKKIKIHFVKVKGHSGDKYNDIADKLASESISF